ENVRKTTLVGTYPSNSFGLYDMHGNVWEWCLDPWHKNYEYAPTNGSAWVDGEDSNARVARGGSWLVHPRNCRSASRNNNNCDYRYNFIGFRVVCSPPRTP
ncbi:MAG: formylglycine-generating enzyme family protein, partial [Cyanobacteria bacterium J06626_14]